MKIWSQETGQTAIYKTLDRNQGSRNMNHTNTCVSIAHGFHQLYGFILLLYGQQYLSKTASALRLVLSVINTISAEACQFYC
jgi:succinate dehydrogenase/fumarate reductase cytochrome b subunit